MQSTLLKGALYFTPNEPMLSRYLNIVVPLVLFGVIAFFVKDIPFYEYDTLCWRIWAEHNFEAGLTNAYNDEGSEMRTNYLPLYHYILYSYGMLCGSPESIRENMAYLKLITLAIDWLGLWYIYKWIDRKVAFYWIVLLSVANLAYAYNTLIWGQVDGISATFAFISAYYGFHRKTVLSSVFFVLALNMKLQAIIFFPVWGFFYLQYALEQRTVRAFLLPLAAFVAMQFVVLIPFLGTIDRVKDVVFESVGQFAYVSANAYNYWYAVLGNKIWHLPDIHGYIGTITYKRFGFAAFFISSVLAMIPLLRALYSRIVAGAKTFELTRPQVWLICALISLGFFYFNTQMHERYSHPAFIFITAYALFTKDFIPYVLFSIAYFLNLELVGVVLKRASYQTEIPYQMYIGWVFGAILIYLFIKLWSSSRQKQVH